jgi:hypothetical protein
MDLDLEHIYHRLYSYCEAHGFAGPDPFDGLNSRIFQATPLRHSALARRILQQVVKRSPINLRSWLAVSEGVNSKALALFSLAELARFRTNHEGFHLDNARKHTDRLLARGVVGETNDGHPTLAFGYNFDWQSRYFFAPAGTPAIVPTAFASQAFVEAFEAADDQKYLAAAGAICNFILTSLNRPVETADEICFSYTPLDDTRIFNASLLAGECLARVSAATDNSEYLDMAAKTVRYVMRRQRPDGSWPYGEADSQGWVDNFHTAYVVLSLYRLSALSPDLSAATSGPLRRGIDYWIDNFFLDDGTPKYYNSLVYPVDIHAAAVSIAALSEMSEADTRLPPLAKKVADWTIENMLDQEGYFYYQMRENGVLKTPFMRWGQAWMAYASARLLEGEKSRTAR